MFGNSSDKETFLNTQSKLPLSQPEAISSCAIIACYLGEEVVTSPHYNLLSRSCREQEGLPRDSFSPGCISNFPELSQSLQYFRHQF